MVGGLPMTINQPEVHNKRWEEWLEHVLAELTRLNSCYETLRDEVTSLRVDLATYKAKGGEGISGDVIKDVVDLKVNMSALKVKIGIIATLSAFIGGVIPTVVMMAMKK
jgi:hypothetical protein